MGGMSVLEELEEIRLFLDSCGYEDDARRVALCITELRAPIEASEQAYLRGFAAGQKRALHRVSMLLQTEIQSANATDPEVEAARRELMEAYSAATRDSAA